MEDLIRGAETGKDSEKEGEKGTAEGSLHGRCEDRCKLKLSGLSLPVENRKIDFSPLPLFRALILKHI